MITSPIFQTSAFDQRDIPSFVDLREFARDASRGRRADSPSGSDPFQAARRVLDWRPGPVTAGVIELKPGAGSIDHLPADDFILVDEGCLTLTQGESSWVLAPGHGAVIPHGASFSWSTQQKTSLFFTRYNYSRAGDGRIAPIQQSPELKASGTPPLDLLTTPAPSCRNHTDYSSSDGEFMCGTWDSTPYARSPLFYKHYELMHLLQGEVHFEDESGRSRSFKKGDVFLIEQGAKCTWDSREHVAKLYVIYRPK